MSRKITTKALSVNKDKVRLTAENGNLIVNTVDAGGDLTPITSTIIRDQEISSLAAELDAERLSALEVVKNSTYGIVIDSVATGAGSHQQTFVLSNRIFGSKPVVTATMVGNPLDPIYDITISSVTETSNAGIYQVTFEFSDELESTRSDGISTAYKINILAAVDGTDSDLDGIPDHTDTDDDNDGILDVDEANPVLTEDEDSGFYLVNDAIVNNSASTSGIKRSVIPVLSPDADSVAVAYPYYGKVKVFDIDGSNGWTQRGSDISLVSHRFFSHSTTQKLCLSSDKNTLALAFAGANISSNFMKVYKWENDAWSQVGSDITPSDTVTYFGTSTCLSDDGTRFVVADVTRFRVYDLIDGEWSQVGSTITISSSESSNIVHNSVSCNSDCTVIALAHSHEDIPVYEWNESSSDWVQKGSTITGAGPNGTSYKNKIIDLTSDGDGLLVQNNSSQTATVYTWSGSQWDTKGSAISFSSLTPYSAQNSASLSDDKETLLLGIPHIGINNNTVNTSEGGVVIYSWDSSNEEWSLVSSIEGQVAGERMGFAQLSRDGSKFVVGPAAEYISNMDEYVKVYQISNS